MIYEEFVLEIKRLADIAREQEKEIKQCEDSREGHNYQVQGFSEIVHSEFMWNRLPTGDVVFASYVCLNCGQRISPEENKQYYRQQLIKNTARIEREMIIEESREFFEGEDTK